MNSFSDYYNLSKKDYEYKLKIACCEFSEDHKARIKDALQKYDLKGDITYKKTPLQENPMDFPNLNNVEVYIADLVVLYPASPETLRGYLADVTGINSACIAVYRKGDPRLQDQEDYLHRSSSEFKDNYEPALGSDYSSEDNSNLYGDKYNVDFLKSLSDQKSKRAKNTVTNTLIPDQKSDTISHSKPQDQSSNDTSPLTNVEIKRATPVKKVTLFSKGNE